MTDKIYIFDTTLRDGEQSPGCTMNVEEKIMIAEVLDDMKVDIIEAGFAISSNGDFQAVNEIAKRAKHASVCSLARAITKDIDRAGEAVKPAKRPRIHTFMSTSDIHLKYQFRKTREEALDIIGTTVKHARNLCDDVEWSAMDATRTELDFLCKAVEIAIKNGARTINLPDTVGYSIPSEIYHIFSTVRNKVPNADKAIFSFHGQNDLGMAVANAISAIQAGARQIECTINGIGERAGNTSLEEVVMTLKTRADLLKYQCDVKSEYIMRASKMIVNVTGLHVQANKAIVGANAFAHESGIHQDGVLKHAETYEIMKPESIGLSKNKLVMGKHSGRAAFKDKLKDLNLHVADDELDAVFANFKELADKKKEVYDDDIIALVDDTAKESSADKIQFVYSEIHCGSKGPQKAKVCLKVNGSEKCVEANGQGPIDAIFKAIKEISGTDVHLMLYDVVLIEASSVSEVKFGFQIFELMANAAMKNGKKIFFSPPTDADQLYPKVKKDISEERARITRNRAIFNEIINYKHTEVISMNETELVMMFGEYDAARGNLTVNSPDDKNFTQALNNLQAILKKKLTSINPANPEPVAFVSFGKLGAYAITASQCVFVPALEIKNIIDTTGAGDAFASGCIIKQNEIISSTLTFSESHLKEMLTHGETLANKVIAQYGAQLIQAQ